MGRSPARIAPASRASTKAVKENERTVNLLVNSKRLEVEKDVKDVFKHSGACGWLNKANCIDPLQNIFWRFVQHLFHYSPGHFDCQFYGWLYNTLTHSFLFQKIPSVFWISPNSNAGNTCKAAGTEPTSLNAGILCHCTTSQKFPART